MDEHVDDAQAALLREEALAVIAVLQEMGIIPVLIGGLALRAHGVACRTMDVDLLLDCGVRRLRVVARRLQSIGYRLDARNAQSIREVIAVRCFRGGVQIDLLSASLSRRTRDVHSHATRMHWFDARVNIARPSDVIIEKIRTRRTDDLSGTEGAIRSLMSDSERLEALQECQRLDLTGVHGVWVRAFFGGQR
jgi:hypothetical protein